MIRFSKDRNKIIKDIVNDLIEYQNTVEDWAGGEQHCTSDRQGLR